MPNNGRMAEEIQIDAIHVTEGRKGFDLVIKQPDIETENCAEQGNTVAMGVD